MRAATIRNEPYRVLFPLGIVHAWAGVMPWLLLGAGMSDGYPSIFHALVQVQGFLASFTAGFLMTFVPRRTGTDSATVGEIATAVVGPLGVTASAWLEEWAISQMFWLVFAAMLVAFVTRRASHARSNDGTTSVAWIRAALVGSILGSVLTAAGAARPDGMWLHDVGKGMVLQGFPAALVLGAGTFLLPLVTRGERPSAATRRSRVVHSIAAILFFASFVVEASSLRAAFAMRASVAAAILVTSAGLHRLPVGTAAHRWIAWASAWCVPAGFALVALLPAWKRVALHVTLLGGFGALVLAVSIHVAHAHARRAPSNASGRAVALLLLAALVCRVLVDVDRERFLPWLAAGAASFLLATLAWTWSVTRALIGGPATDSASHGLSVVQLAAAKDGR